jgi:hypothetical protein
VIRHRGVNLAPWNIDGRRPGRVPVFYHFHGMARQSGGRWYSHFPHLQTRFEFVRDEIYLPYLSALEAERRALVDDFGVEGTGAVRPSWDVPPALEFSPPASPETALPDQKIG